MKWMIITAAILSLAVAAIAAEPQSEGSPSTVKLLDEQMRDLLLERDQVLAGLNAEYAAALPSERTALEATYAATQVSYEIQLLELMVQYYDLTGNTELKNRAVANLEQMLAPTPRQIQVGN
ncbi:MAG: hypothetical protein IPP40_07555 [bacterium]|nr:hypothetical protein [bacterium]